LKKTCYCCSKKGHFSNICPEKDKRSKDEWAVKKAMMHAQAKSEKETEENDDNDNASQAFAEVKLEQQTERMEESHHKEREPTQQR
jgi:hypothetical protein